MTKIASRNRHSRRHARPDKHKIQPSPDRKLQMRIAGYALIVILAAIPFAMGKYFEFNYPDPFDSGGYVYSAKHILDGAEIGVEEKPSAKLATLLVNMFGIWLFRDFSETGPKFMQMVFQMAALILMFVAVRKLFGTLSAAVAVIIASVYLSAPLIAKFGNVKEQHMIAFMVMGVSCFVLRQLDGKWWWAVLAGAFLSWAPLFKETGTSAIG
ncbi:MAG: glycosyltransferase family 39 protein, partial [Planctomycetota bacterium]